ncbi:N2227-like protein-domain-containing protein [Pelagophyceae sp. CCMP2097]|nr:N2227-like protein-domain-containing protein [Pelagophyceae sp. CCMP2097]
MSGMVEEFHEGETAGAREEREHFERVVGSFIGYEEVALAEEKRARNAAKRLSADLERLLPPGSMQKRLDLLHEAARVNADFLRAVVKNQGSFGPLDAAHVGTAGRPPTSRPREADFSKVRSTLHSCVRDWGAEGAAERAQSYDPMVQELLRVLPVVDGVNRNRQRVLVPGAGLARLVLEICAAGYAAQGNEFSYHMLLVSNFILNSRLDPGAIEIRPFIDQPSNCVEAEDRTRVVSIPDVSPDELLTRHAGNAQQHDAPVDFSMAAGEFLEVYRDQTSEWHAVATCFFLDTAPVALEYVDAIYRLLKPGGAWVNLGPLLYHWVPSSSADLVACGDDGTYDERYSLSLEFSWDELKHAIIARGFDIVKEERRACNYTANSKSMMRTHYDTIFFTAIKREIP